MPQQTTAKIIPLDNRMQHSMYTRPHRSVETMTPGQQVIICPDPDTRLEIAYDQDDGIYTPRFKCWHLGVRIKDYFMDDNHQIDMRHTIHRMITLSSTKYTESGTRPIQSVIEIEITPYSWNR